MSMHISSLYEQVTNDIIVQLEAGAPPWVKVWDSEAGGFLPANAATRRQYSGINIAILWSVAGRHSYPTHEWMTFKQALELGANVRKGEKATQIVFVKQLTRSDEHVKDTSNEGAEDIRSPKKVTVLKTFAVFNVAQIDGLIPSVSPLAIERAVDEHFTRVQEFVGRAGVEVTHGPYEPCYIPSLDSVCLPVREAFHANENYYATLLHECVHWTGAGHRLNRELRNRYGSKEYAAEELVAELGAAFLCAHLGVKGEIRHAGYIGSWLKLLTEDMRAIFTAAAKASEAANYLRSLQIRRA